MKFRVWYRDDFEDCENDEDRDDRAWAVPDTRSVFYPDRPGVPCDDVRDAAEKFAEYFHTHREGWENTWPIEFIVHDGLAYHVVEVERETVPEFHAAKPKPLEIK